MQKSVIRVQICDTGANYKQALIGSKTIETKESQLH